MALSKEEIFNIKDIEIREVYVPEWNGTVYIRTMSGVDRDRFDESLQSATRKDGTVDIRTLRARLLALCICDASGSPLFSLADVEKLNQKSSKALMRLFAVAQDLNGLTEEAIQELLGNSEGDRSAASGSSSPGS